MQTSNKRWQQAAIMTALLSLGMGTAMAQSSYGQPEKTRAEVKADLVRLERAGYNPGQNDLYYPNNLQKAERRADQADGQGY